MRERNRRLLSIVFPTIVDKDFIRMYPEEYYKKPKTFGELRDKTWYKYNMKLLKRLGFRRKQEMFKR